MKQITPEQCRERLSSSNPPLLLDIREDWEREIASLDFATYIPMHQVPDRLGEIDRQRPVVVMCRSGARSRQVAAYLSQNGYGDVSNLAGGICAWAETLDPTIPTY